MEATGGGGSVCNTIAGVLGNVLEWYDFALFGFFSDVIAEVFFPPDTGNDNLIKSFCIFGGAFVMRPIGGLVMGYVGDKHGRKTALTKSLFLMAIPTFAMGFLPTYNQVGWLSPFLLVVCRLLQGVSVGGQLPASLVYTVERHPRESWGFYGSLPMVAADCGTLAGNIVGATIRSALNDEQLVSFGWRLPFYSGILIAGVAVYLSIYGEDVHTNAGVFDQENSEHNNPLKVACMSKNRLALVGTSLTCMLWGGGFYISFVWMAIYMETLLQTPITNAFWVNACALFFGQTCTLPIAGIVSDKIGRVKTMTIAAIAMAIWGPLVIVIIGTTSNSFVAFLVQFFLGISLSFFGAPLCAWLVETFDPEIRLTSASVGYDIAHATAAGFSPAIATALFSDVGRFTPALLYPLLSALTLSGMYLMYSHQKAYGVEKDPSTQQRGSPSKADVELPPVS